MDTGRFYGQKGNSWRKNMNTVMLNEGIWGDLKYTLNGHTYIIPAKHLVSKTNINLCLTACKNNDIKTLKKMDIKVLGIGG